MLYIFIWLYINLLSAEQVGKGYTKTRASVFALLFHQLLLFGLRVFFVILFSKKYKSI